MNQHDLVIEIERRKQLVNTSPDHGTRGQRLHDFHCWLSGIEFATGQVFPVKFDPSWQPGQSETKS